MINCFLLFCFLLQIKNIGILAKTETYGMECRARSKNLYYCGQEAETPSKKDSLLFAPVVNPIYTAFAHTYPDEATAHRGIDMIGGTTILAAEAGIVVDACRIACVGSYGRYVIVQHTPDLFTVYGHLDQVFVKKGEQVERVSGVEGTALGIMGNTGKSFGTHLHFEVRSQASDAYQYRMDPIAFLDVYLKECSNMFLLVDALQSSVHRYQQWYSLQADGKIIAKQQSI